MKTLIAILIYPLLLFGCVQNNNCDYNGALNYINENLYYVPSNEWKITMEANFPDSTKYYDLYQEQGDTIYYLTININCTERLDQDRYNIEHIKRYFKGKYVYDLIFEQGDTVIFYKALFDDQSKKEFYLGKYYYMFLHPKELYNLGFSEDDFLFIRDNLDSLKKIRGDSLIL